MTDDDETGRGDRLISRREFLASTVAGTALGGVGRAAGRQQVAKRFFIGGRVSGWKSLPKGVIGAGKVNPTLNLTAGKRYELTWENLDGVPHNFVIRSADGKTLVRTKIMSEQGATQTVRFTATEAMDEYLCQVHPTTMHGQVTVAPGGAETVPANQTTTPAETTQVQTPTETTTTTTEATTTPTETTTTTTPTTTEKGGQAERQQLVKSFYIGGRVTGWQALPKGPINSGTNPTLNLVAGKQYEVTWKNLDGTPHNFTIRDSQGNKLLQTRTISQQGATVTTRFTASREMTTYLCTIHPTTMQGNIVVSAQGGAPVRGAATAPAGKQGGQGVPIPDTATLVAMLWTAALAVTVGLSAFILRHFDHLDEPSE